MTLYNNEIKSIFLADDILPLGKFETIPVLPILDGNAESYPNVSIISETIDTDTLLQEAYTHMRIIGFNYVKPRLQYINPAVTEEILRETLADVGFYKGSYQSYSLRKVGTNELEDWVLPKTRNFFKLLPFNTFRQQYAVAAPKWNTKLHRDHANFKLHGFRVMVPLNADVFMGYEINNKNIIYRLKKGGMYFVNIAKMHRGFNESETTERINLIMQIDTDSIIINSKELDPLTDTEIAGLPEYARQYNTWKFGYEL